MEKSDRLVFILAMALSAVSIVAVYQHFRLEEAKKHVLEAQSAVEILVRANQSLVNSASDQVENTASSQGNGNSEAP